MDEQQICPRVPMGDDAFMPMPTHRLAWQMRYGNPMIYRYDAAQVIEAYRYLVLECTKEEAWRRLKLLRRQMEMLLQLEQG